MFVLYSLKIHFVTNGLIINTCSYVFLVITLAPRRNPHWKTSMRQTQNFLSSFIGWKFRCVSRISWLTLWWTQFLIARRYQVPVQISTYFRINALETRQCWKFWVETLLFHIGHYQKVPLFYKALSLINSDWNDWLWRMNLDSRALDVLINW